MNNLSLLLIFLCSCLYFFTGSSKLLFIQEIFRHGGRYPIFPNSADNTTSIPENNIGQLTTQGQKMHYILGKIMYEEYWHQLFGNTSQLNQSNFYVQSTNYNRTIQSCLAHLRGLFSNLKPLQLSKQQMQFSIPHWNTKISGQDGHVYEQQKGFYPLSFNIQKNGKQSSSNGDFLLAFSPQNCPKQQQWMMQNLRGPFVTELLENTDIKKSLQALSKEIGTNVSLIDMMRYYDNYIACKFLGLPFLNIFEDPKHAKTFKYTHSIVVYTILFLTETQKKISSYRFFRQTINNIKRSIRHPYFKWVIYSAHDTTLANALIAMNMTNAECIYNQLKSNSPNTNHKCLTTYPPFASSLIFEIHENFMCDLFNLRNSQHSIKIRFSGQYLKIPFCNYKIQCPLEDFYSWYDLQLSPLETQDFKMMCEKTETSGKE